MKKIILASALVLAAIASTPADAGQRGNRGSQMTNVNVNLDTGRGGLLGTVLGLVRGGHNNGLNLNANVQTGRGGILGTSSAAGNRHRQPAAATARA